MSYQRIPSKYIPQRRVFNNHSRNARCAHYWGREAQKVQRAAQNFKIKPGTGSCHPLLALLLAGGLGLAGADVQAQESNGQDTSIYDHDNDGAIDEQCGKPDYKEGQIYPFNLTLTDDMQNGTDVFHQNETNSIYLFTGCNGNVNEGNPLYSYLIHRIAKENVPNYKEAKDALYSCPGLDRCYYNTGPKGPVKFDAVLKDRVIHRDPHGFVDKDRQSLNFEVIGPVELPAQPHKEDVNLSHYLIGSLLTVGAAIGVYTAAKSRKKKN